MLDQLLDISTNFGIDTLLLLPVLVTLEALLSADNAIALAAIAQGLDGEDQQRRALNFGLLIAFVLRVGLILTAGWVLQFWQFEVLGAAYLLWLVYKHFTSEADDQEHHHGPRFASVWQAIPIIALTDLAFSLDSVTTALALSEEILIILLGGTIGVLTLRFMAGLFIRWLEEYERLEDAGFITVAFVGIRLLMRVIDPTLVPPDWVMVSMIIVIFVWGFSKRLEEPESAIADAPSNSINGHTAASELADLSTANGKTNDRELQQSPSSNPASDVEYAEPS
jgi:YkoY family integral membrane protein